MNPRLIIIHGLNNNLQCFSPLKEKMMSIGFECEFLCLPGHGQERDEVREMERAMEVFDRQLRPLITEPYFVIAFSQGALYLQLWLEKTSERKPQAQVLLAPALYIRNYQYLKKIMFTLPKFFIIFSQMPAPLRRYRYLHIWEYRNLFNKAELFEQSFQKLHIPSLVIVDPKDELVDAKKLKVELEKTGASVLFWPRPYLAGKKPGKYHILFHPDYFSPDDWDKFTYTISEFFKKLG